MSFAVLLFSVSAAEYLPGDLNEDRSVDIMDAALLLQHSVFPNEYPLTYPGTIDFDHDGTIDIRDAVRLIQYSLYPEQYPITEPTAAAMLKADSRTVSAGAAQVEIKVSLQHNPGFLTMALNMEFDSDVLKLTRVTSGSDYSDYSFIAPFNKKSGCTAAWFASDLPDEIVDGNIMTLQFTVSENAPAGTYPITISCPDDGSTVDGNKDEYPITNTVGYIIVK